jgi:hypothetical protein
LVITCRSAMTGCHWKLKHGEWLMMYAGSRIKGCCRNDVLNQDNSVTALITPKAKRPFTPEREMMLNIWGEK